MQKTIEPVTEKDRLNFPFQQLPLFDGDLQPVNPTTDSRVQISKNAKRHTN